ncbi:hypothetical protein ACB092_07G142300 [Castanea dentata]
MSCGTSKLEMEAKILGRNILWCKNSIYKLPYQSSGTKNKSRLALKVKASYKKLRMIKTLLITWCHCLCWIWFSNAHNLHISFLFYLIHR